MQLIALTPTVTNECRGRSGARNLNCSFRKLCLHPKCAIGPHPWDGSEAKCWVLNGETEHLADFQENGRFPMREKLTFCENNLCFRINDTFPKRENGRKHENR